MVAKQGQLLELVKGSPFSCSLSKDWMDEAKLKSIESLKYFLPTNFWADFVTRKYKLTLECLKKDWENDEILKVVFRNFQQKDMPRDAEYEAGQQKVPRRETIGGTQVPQRTLVDVPVPLTQKKPEQKHHPSSKLGKDKNNTTLFASFSKK